MSSSPSAVLPHFDLYSRIERSIISRLATGMRGMVKEVASYGGQLDDDPARIIQVLPAAWVTFGGVMRTAPYSTSKTKSTVTGRFAVMVGQVNARSEVASRHGTGRPQEVGTNLLVWAVRRLLSQQDLVDQDPGLQISALEPGRVRPVFNTSVDGRAMSVFACEFDTTWIEHALPNSRFPVPTATSAEPGVPGSDYDQAFGLFPATRTDEPLPWLGGISVRLYPVPPSPGPDTPPRLASDILFPHDEDNS